MPSLERFPFPYMCSFFARFYPYQLDSNMLTAKEHQSIVSNGTKLLTLLLKKLILKSEQLWTLNIEKLDIVYIKEIINHFHPYLQFQHGVGAFYKLYLLSNQSLDAVPNYQRESCILENKLELEAMNLAQNIIRLYQVELITQELQHLLKIIIHNQNFKARKAKIQNVRQTTQSRYHSVAFERKKEKKSKKVQMIELQLSQTQSVIQIEQFVFDRRQKQLQFPCKVTHDIDTSILILTKDRQQQNLNCNQQKCTVQKVINSLYFQRSSYNSAQQVKIEAETETQKFKQPSNGFDLVLRYQDFFSEQFPQTQSVIVQVKQQNAEPSKQIQKDKTVKAKRKRIKPKLKSK